MKLVVCLSLTVVAAATAFACSSSNSPGSPPGDSQNGDAAVDSTAPGTLDSSVPNPGTDDSSVPNPGTDSATPVDSSTPVSDAGTDSATTPLSFNTDIYAPIIAKHCTGCHAVAADGGLGSGVAFGKLDMTTVDAGYANLVNAHAAGSACAVLGDGGAGPIRVIPGNAAGSLLYEKVNGFVTAPPCGGAMPKSGEIPDGGQAIVTAQIQAWINQGALP